MGSGSNRHGRTCFLLPRSRLPLSTVRMVMIVAGFCVLLIPLLFWWSFSGNRSFASDESTVAVTAPSLLLGQEPPRGTSVATLPVPPKPNPAVGQQPIIPHGSPQPQYQYQQSPPLTILELTNSNTPNMDHTSERKACEAKAFVYIEDIIATKNSQTTTRVLF